LPKSADKFAPNDASFARAAKIQGHVAIWANVALAAFKFFAGMVTGSLAIIADAWHTLSDSLSSLVMLVGLKISEKPADEEHPFGHGRAELVAAVVIGMLLAAVGFEFVVSGIKKIFAHETAEFGALGVVAMVVTIFVKEIMAQYAFWCARKTGLVSLRADGFHHRSDAISSVVVLGGMGANALSGGKLWRMDGALGAVVGIMLLRGAWTGLRDAGTRLLGEAVDAETEAKIREIAQRVSGDAELNLHHIHFHDYGRHREITFHIRLSPETPLAEAHRRGSEIERTILDELGIDATIHIEPKREFPVPADVPAEEKS